MINITRNQFETPTTETVLSSHWHDATLRDCDDLRGYTEHVDFNGRFWTILPEMYGVLLTSCSELGDLTNYLFVINSAQKDACSECDQRALEQSAYVIKIDTKIWNT